MFRRSSHELDQIPPELSGESGVALVSFEKRDRSEAELRVAFGTVFDQLARRLPQYASGVMEFDVTNLGSPQGGSHYSTSNLSGDYHTDGSLLPHIPNIVGLGCIRAALSGGESVLIDASMIGHWLEQNCPAQYAVLTGEFLFDRSGQFDPPQARQKIFTVCPSGSPTVIYLRRYIEDGHQKAGVALTNEQIEALDCFDRLVEEPRFRQQVLLKPGELLLFDNRRFLHGRTAFEDPPEPSQRRLLIRLYGEMKE